MESFYRGLVILSVLGLLATPVAAGPRNLNDLARSVEQADVAPVKKDDEIPYETMERNGLAVSYNLQLRDDGLGPTYRLVLILRNNSTGPIEFEPRLTLIDGGGVMVRPYSYDSFRALASVLLTLSGMPTPPIPASRSAQNRSYEGTVTSRSTGERYDYTAKSTSTGSFSGGFAEGYAIGAQAKARKDAENALTLISWADSYWLDGRYTVPAGAGLSGGIMYRGSKKPILPMRLVVEVAGERFEFDTVAKK